MITNQKKTAWESLLWIGLCLPAMLGPAAHADVAYHEEGNRIWVTDFPEEAPAAMDTLLAADERSGWGKVAYDKATDTYTVDADLWIGDDRSLGTFLRIGDADHPNITVIVKGTVWVLPPKESMARSDGCASIINRLTLGDPKNDAIRATLKIDCTTRGEHGVYVGYRSHDSKTRIERGDLHVYNSTITAAAQDEKHLWGVRDYTDETASPRWSSPGWYGSDIRLINATLSWFEGCPTYGMNTGKLDARGTVDSMRPNERMLIQETVFEHGECAVRNGGQYLRDSVFRHMKTAIAEGGALSARLIDCTFENNEMNWTLGSMMSGGIVMVDCRVGPPQKPMVLNKNRLTPEESVRRNIPVRPSCLERRTLEIKVVDAAGNPVPWAMVVVTCKEDPEQVTRGAALTDENGLIPGDPDHGMVITVKGYRATDDPENPERLSFRYEAVATAKGFKSGTVDLPNDRPIPKPLVIEPEK